MKSLYLQGSTVHGTDIIELRMIKLINRRPSKLCTQLMYLYNYVPTELSSQLHKLHT